MNAPYYSDESVTVLAGDCIDMMRELPDASVDAVVTDPPYGLGFMGKEWDSPGGTGDFPMRRFDAINTVNTGASKQGGRQRTTEDFAKRQARDARAYGAWCERWAAECLRVLKPGGHLLAFGGTRTYHRIACAVEDAGFEMRDSIAWLYGSGFPKSLDVSKAIDRHLGAERPVVGRSVGAGNGSVVGLGQAPSMASEYDVTSAATAAAAAEGWGTALKPAHEPIVVGRKSLSGTVAANVLAHGTGALNIDACRTATGDSLGGGQTSGSVKFAHEGWNRPWMDDPEVVARVAADARTAVAHAEALGRWPTNVLLDESQAEALDAETGTLTGGVLSPANNVKASHNAAMSGPNQADRIKGTFGGDTGGASRFFPTFHYEAKAGSSERPSANGVLHPTVKPLDLMRWLVRLVTPPGGTVLDPFLGSGTTAEACVIEGFRCIGIERETDYLPLIVARLTKPLECVLDFGVTG